MIKFLIVLVFLPLWAHASSCAKDIKILSIHLTEERIMAEARRDNLTFGRVMDCLRWNRERLGDMNFKKPTKLEAKKVFMNGDKIIVSKHEYEPYVWTVSTQFQNESVEGVFDTEFTLTSGNILFARKYPVGNYSFFETSLGAQLTSVNVSEPDDTDGNKSDLALVGGLKFTNKANATQKLSLHAYADRYLVYDENDGGTEPDYNLAYRFNLMGGWEVLVVDALSLGIEAGLNTVVSEWEPGFQFGGKAGYTWGRTSLNFRYVRASVKTEASDDTTNQISLNLSYVY